MKWYTHIVSAALATAMIAPSQVALASIFAVFPDIFEKALFLQHRHPLVHNFVFPLLFLPSTFIGASGVFLGIFHHILLDATTLHGVYLFNYKVHGPLNTNNPVHNVIMIFLHLIAYVLVA